MLNPVYTPFAFMGGRSWGEITACEQAKAMDSSIAIGIASTLSTVIIFFGQWLFWKSIPSTAASALPIALVLTVVYALFYRLLIRSSELLSWWGKAIVLSLGFGLAGVNATLAGHELVLLPFAPQVQEMTVLLGNSSVGDLRNTTEAALGVDGLRTDAQEARKDEDAARQRLNTVPTDIQNQLQQAQACDQQATRMRAALPEPGDPSRTSALAAWREQRRRCAALNTSARTALAQHRTQANQDLNAAVQQRHAATNKLTQAQNQSDTTVTTAAPALAASASTGFGRHKALWAAVKAGKVPGWAAYGLMLVALVLEGAGLLLKLFLPKDEATYARVAQARITSAMGDSELTYTQAFRAQIKPAIKAQATQMRADTQRLILSHLGPSMNTRFAAEQFARAAESTRSAQRRSGQAATPVIDELAKVMPGDWAPGTT